MVCLCVSRLARPAGCPSSAEAAGTMHANAAPTAAATRNLRFMLAPPEKVWFDTLNVRTGGPATAMRHRTKRASCRLHRKCAGCDRTALPKSVAVDDTQGIDRLLQLGAHRAAVDRKR